MVTKSRGMILVGMVMMVGMGCLNNWFYGTIAARLPFTPVSMFQGLTHYGIENPDMTLSSVTFIFVLSQLSIGTYLKRLMQLEGPRVSQPNLQPAWLK